MYGDSDAQVVHFKNASILMQNADKLEAKTSCLYRPKGGTRCYPYEKLIIPENK
jgi:hypothetical protein